MRIIAGERRGHKLAAMPGRDLRPTSDLVREAIFDILRDEIDDRIVFDLFAGTGALGLEALSRGAARAVFVERDRDHVALIRRNIATLRFEDRARVIATDAYRWGRSFVPIGPEPLAVFIDPPYAEFARRRDSFGRWLAELVAKLPPGSIVVVETGESLEPVLDEPDRWDRRHYGSTHVSILRLEDGPSLRADDDEPDQRPDATPDDH